MKTDVQKKAPSHWPLALLSTLASFVNMIFPLLLVRLLSPEEVGVSRIFFLYITIGPALAMTGGLKSGLAYWAGQGERGKLAMQMSGILTLAGAILTSLLLLACEGSISRSLEWPGQITAVYAFAMPVTIVGLFFDEVFIVAGRVWTGALFYSGFELLKTAAMLAAALQYHTLFAIFAAYAAMILLKAALGLLVALRLGLIGMGFDYGVLRELIKYALPVSLSLPLGVLVQSADKVIMSVAVPPADYAIYSIGCLMIPPLLILEQSITRLLIPRIAASFTAGDSTEAAALYKEAVSKLAFWILPAVTGLIVFADPIVELLFTAKYQVASGYLHWFALSYLFLIVPFDTMARARGDSAWMLGNFLLFSVLSLWLAYVLVGVWGAYGALAGMLICGFLMRLHALHYQVGRCRMRSRDCMPYGYLATRVAICLVLAAIAMRSRDYFGTQMSWLAVCGPAFAVLYFIFSGLAAGVGRAFESGERRVLIISQSLEIGGLERMVLALSARLQAAGDWRPYVLAYDQQQERLDSTLVPEFERLGIPVHTFKKSSGFSPRVVWEILRCISRNSISVLHCHDLGGLIYGSIARALTCGRVKLVATQHSFIHLDQDKRYKIYEKLFTRMTDELTAVSPDIERTYRELGFRTKRISLITNGVVFPEVLPVARSERIALRTAVARSCAAAGQLNGMEDQIWLLYLARIFPRKGQDHVLRLWQNLPAGVRSRCVLIFVGPEAQAGALQGLEEEIRRAPDPARIVVAGPSRDPQTWLRSADVYISCSEYEGMPLGPLEAVGTGLPALLSEIPGHEFLRNLSQQYRLSDPAEGARRLESMIEKIEGAGEAYYSGCIASSAPLRHDFSLDRMVGEYRSVYARAVGVSASLEHEFHTSPAAARGVKMAEGTRIQPAEA